MNRLAVSTGCFYPDTPENAVKEISKTGAKAIEFFINTGRESSPSYIHELRTMLDAYGLSVTSVHPYTSFAEPYLLFSAYKRRFLDGLDIYDRFFEICTELGAPIFNFHGQKLEYETTLSQYCEVYGTLFERAAAQNVIFSQENVRKYYSGSPEFEKSLIDKLGDKVAFTFDIKQARMTGNDPMLFAQTIADRLCLVHLNDFNDTDDCLLPGEGTFDIPAFYALLRSRGYNGAYVIEVYSRNYGGIEDIKKSTAKMNVILKGGLL